LAVGSSLAADAVAAEVVAEFARRGIDTILLRGPAIARWLYAAGERSYYDVDLLVEPAAVASAENTLFELGFRGPSLTRKRPGPRRHAEMWARGDAPPVDLHESLVGIGVSHLDLWQALCEHTDSIAVHDQEARCLDHLALLLVVTLHAAQHGFEAATRDLDVALGRATEDDWRYALELAERLDAQAAFEAGLRTLPAGRDLADGLQLQATPSPETLLRAEVAPDLTLALNWLAESGSTRARVTFVLGKLFPPPERMRAGSTRARRSSLGLVAAYVSRLLWLIWRAPPAVRAVRRARRQTRS
jgi:hypothetical protein